MDIVRRQVPLEAPEGDKREIRARFTARTVDRHRDIVEPAGLGLDAWIGTGATVLRDHDATKPVARGLPDTIERTDEDVVGTIAFPPAGVSALADETLGLVRSGVLNAVSIGFIPGESRPLETGGLRFTSAELVELSLVSTPSNREAVILERSAPQEATPMETTPQTPESEKTVEVVKAIEKPAAPAVKTSRNAARPYNLLKVIDEMCGTRLTGLEAEVHDELVKASPSKSYRGAAVPWGALFRQAETEPGAGGEFSWVDQRPDLLFEDPAAIRKATALGRLGARFVTTMRESVVIPKVTSRTAAGWTAKDATAAAAGNIGTGDETVTPLYLTGTTQINRSAVKYTEPSLVELHTADLRAAVADTLDTGLMFGDGTSETPVGFFDSSHSYNTDDLAAEPALLDLRGAKARLIEAWNADDSDPRFRWLMAPRMRDQLRFIDVAASVAEAYYPLLAGALNSSGPISILGMASIASARVAIAAGTPDTTTIYAVKADELVAVLFQGLDLIADPYTLSDQGAIRISVFQDVNCLLRSAAAIEGLTTAHLDV